MRNMEDNNLTGDSGRYERDKFLVKLVVWFIVICAVGFVASVILGLLKIAIPAMVIIAVILMLTVLSCMMVYYKIRLRIRRHDDGGE